MNIKTCIERVFEPRCGSHLCGRKASFGPNNDYCKQHSRKHEQTKANLSLWKIPARWHDWKNPLPTEISAREITETTFIDDKGNRLKRNTDWGLHYDTREQAIKAMIAQALSDLRYARQKAIDTDAALKILKGAL